MRRRKSLPDDTLLQAAAAARLCAWHMAVEAQALRSTPDSTSC
jgi:hypothetical protein